MGRLVKELNVEKVIFDNDLKPVQSYNLAKVTGVEAIDRFRLILEIFVRRASTKEAQLQIQLAKLRYQLPHARESVRLAKMGEQPGFLGLGRYEVDVYFEAIKRQITHIRGELRKIREKRKLHRSRRLELGFSLVSLAGYTNAGKSSIFNLLAKESVPVDLGLFTTLSTTTRAVNLDGKRALLTDTVGFIDRLPLPLIEAFHSTLEETIFSDLILLIVDLHESIPEIRRKLTCCLDTIREIGATGVPIVTALNKIDLLSQAESNERLSHLKDAAPNPVAVSALDGTNLDELKQEMSKHLKSHVEASFALPLDDESTSFISELYNRTDVLETIYGDGEVEIRLAAPPWFLDKVRGRVEKLGGRLLERKAS